MSKSKILNRKEIEQLLKEGNFLSWSSMEGQSKILDKSYNAIGSVRFETFLKLRNELNLKEYYEHGTSRELYILA